MCFYLFLMQIFSKTVAIYFLFAIFEVIKQLYELKPSTTL